MTTFKERAVEVLTTHKHREGHNCPYCEQFYGDLVDRLVPLIEELHPSALSTASGELLDRIQVLVKRCEDLEARAKALEEEANRPCSCGCGDWNRSQLPEVFG